MSLTSLITVLVGAFAIVSLVIYSGRRAGILGYALQRNRSTRKGPGRGRGARAETLSDELRRWAPRGLRVAAVLVLAATAVETANAVSAVNRVLHGASMVRQARDILGSSPENWNAQRITIARALQAEAATEIQGGATDLKQNPLIGVTRNAPLLGPNVRSLTDLADAALAGTVAFKDYVLIAGTANDTRAATAPPGERLLALLAASRQPADDATRVLEPIVSTLERDLGASPLPPVSTPLQQALDLLRPLRDESRLVAAAARYGPSALGGSKPARYLVLLPNPTELRPSGGFSGAIGAVTMAGGTPTGLTVRNQDDFNPQMKTRQPVPVELARYLKFYKNGLEMGDAGWDPDFPTSARVSEQIYASAGNQPVDGTLSVDPYAVAALLGLTGPVEVPGYGTFDGPTFVTKLNTVVNAASNPAVGKAALPPISAAVLNAALNQPASNWPKMLGIFRDQARQRHLQAYFHDPVLAAATAAAHFDGALVTPGTDYLMLADGNVGATKGDAYVQKAMEVLTEVHPDLGVARHQVTVTYDMPASTGPTDALLNPGDGSYRDYLRFVLPQEALVVSLTTTTAGSKTTGGLGDSISAAHSHQLVGAFIRVPRGSHATVVLTYEVPLTGSTYSLYVQKQAGVPSLNVATTVSYPGRVSKRLDAMVTDLRVGPG